MNIWLGKGCCCKRCVNYESKSPSLGVVCTACDFYSSICLICSENCCIGFEPESQTS